MTDQGIPVPENPREKVPGAWRRLLRRGGLRAQFGWGEKSRAEGLLFLHGLESNPGSSLQTEEEAGLP